MADKITYVATPNVVIVNKENDAVSNHTIKLVGVAPCSQEEGDTRIFVYTWNATEAGSKVIMVKASDTDVVVIAVSVLQALQELGLQQLCCTLVEKSKGMLFFHAFSGCDVVSPFRAKGRSMLETYGMFMMRLPVSSSNSACTNRSECCSRCKCYRFGLTFMTPYNCRCEV